jgi:hypothetical protein
MVSLFAGFFKNVTLTNEGFLYIGLLAVSGSSLVTEEDGWA